MGNHLNINSQLELRLIKTQDANEFIKLIDKNRSYLREWLGWLDKTKTLEDLEKFIEHTTKTISENKALCYLIWKANTIAGIIHLVDIDQANKKASIGYWVGEDFRGQGFAKQACRCLIQHTFDELKLNRLEIRCASGNTASKAVPIALGFKSEGILRQNEWLYDHFVDHNVYSILSSEWHS